MEKGYVNKRPYRTKDDIIQALKDNNGILTYAAKQLEMSIAGLCSRINTGPDSEELTALKLELRKFKKEEDLDLAENEHLKKIKEGNSRHIIYHLKTHGRDRGYGEKSEVQLSSDKDTIWRIERKIINVDD